MSHQQAIDLPTLPESEFCSWVQDGRVMNAFPWGVGDPAKWDRDGHWSAQRFSREPLFTADQMRAAMRTAILADRSRSAAPVAVPDTQNLRPRDTLILTARQLHNALEFIAPDFPLDDDQAEASASIAWCETRKMLDDDGNEYDEPAGHWCWLTDYPEEGGIPLLDEYEAPAPLATPLAPAETSQDARRYQLLRRGQHWSVIDGIGDTLRAEVLDAAIDSRLCADNCTAPALAAAPLGVADRLDAMADAAPTGSLEQSDLYAAATVWRKHLCGGQ